MRKLFWAFTILLSLGVLFNLVLLYDIYVLPPGQPSFCAFGDKFDCGKVAQSPYAKIDGILYYFNWQMREAGVHFALPYPILPIPNPLILIVAFSLWIYAMYLYTSGKNFFSWSPETIWWAVFGAMTFCVLYAAYLFYIASEVLETFCIFCLGLDVVVLSTYVLLFFIRKHYKNYSGVQVH